MEPEGTDAGLLGANLQVPVWLALKTEDTPKSNDGLDGGPRSL